MFFFSFLPVKIYKYHHSTSRTLSLFPQWVRWCPFRKTSSDIFAVQSVVKKQATSRETYWRSALFLVLQRIGRNTNVKIKWLIIVIIMILFSTKNQFVCFSALHSLMTRLLYPPFPMRCHRLSPPQLPSVKNRRNRKKQTSPPCDWQLALSTFHV